MNEGTTERQSPKIPRLFPAAGTFEYSCVAGNLNHSRRVVAAPAGDSRGPVYCARHPGAEYCQAESIQRRRPLLLWRRGSGEKAFQTCSVPAVPSCELIRLLYHQHLHLRATGAQLETQLFQHRCLQRVRRGIRRVPTQVDVISSRQPRRVIKCFIEMTLQVVQQTIDRPVLHLKIVAPDATCAPSATAASRL